MKKINKLGIISILIILSIFLAKDIDALGVSPGRKTIDFVPNLEKDITITVFNNEHRDFTAAISTRGELGNYIELAQTELKFSSGDSEKSFNYKIKLPNYLDKPGSHKAEIVIGEISGADEGKDTVIGALVAVVSQLDVKVPYPGKYVVLNLDMVNTKPNEEVKFFIRVTNLGEENIEHAMAVITILDQNDNEIVKLDTDSKTIKAKDRGELKGRWLADVDLGDYKAVAVVYYDDLKAVVERSFTLGDFFLNPISISVKNFKLGQIAKFNILVENLANKKIEDATAQLLLFDENKTKIMDIKSTSTEIKALNNPELVAYWDTENIKSGIYTGKLILSYGDKSSENRIRTHVSKDKIETELMDLTGLVIKVDDSEAVIFSKEQIIFAGILVLILVNIGWFYFIKRKKR